MKGTFGRLAAVSVAAIISLGAFTGNVTAASTGWHNGYTENFTPDSLNRLSVVQGSSSGWMIGSEALQAIAAGQTLQLDVPGLNIVGNRLVCVDVLPELTTNSNFYSGVTQNIARVVQINLGTGLDVVQILYDVQSQVITVLNSQGLVVDSLPSANLLPFNAFTNICIGVNEILNELLVQIGDNPVQVLNAAVPSGTVQFAQPTVNTARVMFKGLRMYTTPDVPQDVAAYAGPGLNELTLQWAPPAANGGVYVSEYRVFRGTSPENLEFVASVPAGDGQYTDTFAQAVSTQPYYYQVSAVNSIGAGPVSEVVCMQPGAVGMIVMPNMGLGCGEHGLVSSGTLSWL